MATQSIYLKKASVLELYRNSYILATSAHVLCEKWMFVKFI